MDEQKIAGRVAREVTASKSVSDRLNVASRMAKSGGRGTELAIREISLLAEDMVKLYKELRSVQGGVGADEVRTSEAVLDIFDREGIL